MHIKNNNKTRTFIQGLRPFSSSIPKTLKKYLKKGGYNYSSIVDNWMKIVPRNISNSSYPITIKIGKEMRDGNLIISVSHGKELEIEYAKNEIIDKVNSFFGYKCISRITLKIIQNKVKDNNKVPNKIKNLKKIETNIKEINDFNLKNSLSNFLKAYNESNK
tara:strand:+ start:1501 stop:1986 length:486 start_codon:yes stop_codon:yes gene_type:complete